MTLPSPTCSRISLILAALNSAIVQSPALARAIYFNTRIGDEIPAGLYMAVAQVLAYIYQLRAWEQGESRMPPTLASDLPIPPDLKQSPRMGGSGS
jgi:flagellar biosynthetic protein FlhB